MTVLIGDEPARALRKPGAGKVQSLLADCGVTLNGACEFDIQLIDPRAPERWLRQGSLGLGESYMDGQWECERIDQLVARLLHGALDQRIAGTWARRFLNWRSRVQNLQTRRRARTVGERHYDIGNDLFESMLDPYMNYSCAFWERAGTLEQAQRDKMELICRKLELEPGMKLLDIGCGWGGLARYAAEEHGVSVVGLTISDQQYLWAVSRLGNAPVQIRCQDYRDVDGRFDRIVSVGMFEHVGCRNYDVFFRKCHGLLRDGGLMLLHTIGSNASVNSTDPWLHRYIFPNGMLPSVAQIGRAIESRFVMEDWHNFGTDYDQTLMTWHERVNLAWSDLGDRYDDRFRRMWNFYLLACAGAFRARDIQLWQIVLSKGRRESGYRRPGL
ncbi:MAG: cyclopropane-fatty-acyl-phospholipid synthase [Gammaproteobacteria bacterium]|jgi:cyclopropane-fatty-acyl-phospholipid synthase|nr:cyclopropane-fatty-acyl-phospholipid synthase [Porticoccaceae bacterium]MBK79960.1 cyclopropane-fatty-acyl-phospholipid synthase [Gammaproteobacteria bacterium]|tara:strand:+ start:16777 stop:17934 length:1158 start_codon:yes stop_codon:yes gene_type:complete